MSRIDKGWKIESIGGNITIKRFLAVKIDNGNHFWQFKLKDIKEFIDNLESGLLVWDSLEDLYKHSLYS